MFCYVMFQEILEPVDQMFFLSCGVKRPHLYLFIKSEWCYVKLFLFSFQAEQYQKKNRKMLVILILFIIVIVLIIILFGTKF